MCFFRGVGRSIRRLSDADKAAIIANDSQWIDVMHAQDRKSAFIGHSYFHQNPWVSSDVMLYFLLGATAEERGLVRDMDTGFPVFPEDCEENLPQIVDRIRAKFDPKYAQKLTSDPDRD